jgi:hypothetical protein
MSGANAARPGRGLLPAAAALALLAALTGGCSAPHPATRPGPAGTPPAVAPVPVVTDGAAVRLPLDAYLLTPAEEQQVSRAHRVLLARCVRPFGLTLPAPEPAPAGPATPNERRYGITDAARAAAAGYRLSAREPARRPGRSAAGADPALLAVLTGGGPPAVHGRPVPAGGCVEQARVRLRAGAAAVPDDLLAQRLSLASFGQSRQDAQVRAVAGQWSGCMRARGYTYPGPLDPPADRRFHGPVTAAEIATATADIACKRQTNLVGVWSAVESRYQHLHVAAHQAPLERIRRANQAELAVARGLGIRR